MVLRYFLLCFNCMYAFLKLQITSFPEEWQEIIAALGVTPAELKKPKMRQAIMEVLMYHSLHLIVLGCY